MSVLDLFCGMGGLSFGFAAATGDSIEGYDVDKDAVDTYTLNLSKHSCRSQQADLLAWDAGRGDFDVVIGGPPCQPFSVANTVNLGEKHPLYPTFQRYFEIVEDVRPLGFVFENVKGLLSSKYHHLLVRMLSRLRRLYNITYGVVNAADYGVPQKRERLVILGIRTDLGGTPRLPDKTHDRTQSNSFIGRQLYPWVTVKEALVDLLTPSTPNFVKKKKTANQELTMWIINSDNTAMPLPWTTYQTKHPPLSLDEPSRTVWSHVAKASRDLLIPLTLPSTTLLGDGRIRPHGHHTSLGRVYRRVTVRECLRLQSFPDWWSFPETTPKTKQYALVGEAVPPIMAYRIAASLYTSMGKQAREPPNPADWDIPFFKRAFEDYLNAIT